MCVCARVVSSPTCGAHKVYTRQDETRKKKRGARDWTPLLHSLTHFTRSHSTTQHTNEEKTRKIPTAAITAADLGDEAAGREWRKRTRRQPRRKMSLVDCARGVEDGGGEERRRRFWIIHWFLMGRVTTEPTDQPTKSNNRGIEEKTTCGRAPKKKREEISFSRSSPSFSLLLSNEGISFWDLILNTRATTGLDGTGQDGRTDGISSSSLLFHSCFFVVVVSLFVCWYKGANGQAGEEPNRWNQDGW